MEQRYPDSPQPLPLGEITLLFTDISGSSRLWEKHGDAFIPVWQAHDAVLRDAFTRFGGVEVKTEGDAFMVAFPDPAAAVHCAIFAQAALARYPWPPDIAPLRVRMGLHTGEPFVLGNDYFGPVVNRAANTCKAAHGGQILLTDETLKKAQQGLDTKVEFTDLGALRLKDMGTPQRLYQAGHPRLQDQAFPPPRTLEGQPNNLPIQRTSFVGRAKEIEQVAAYLAQGEKPILTITGPSGIGKTRLTLQAAAAHAEWFPDGVWYLRMVEAKTVEDAAREIASVLNLSLDSERSPVAQVREWLADRRCLLILDDANCLPQADRLIRDLLSGSTALRCLATSRETLEIAEGDTLTLGGLETTLGAESQESTSFDIAVVSTPREMRLGGVGPQDVLTGTESGRLLMDRIAAVNPDLILTSDELTAAELLLPHLEGVPINIERAAQLMEIVPPSVVLDELERHLPPKRETGASASVAKIKGIVRRGAQRVRQTVEGATKSPATANLGKLLQGIANVATDRRDEKQAADLGRESLRLSKEAGDDLGVADALRQLARVKWSQGDRQSAAAMLAAAAQLYRRHNSEEYAVTCRELDSARAELSGIAGENYVAPPIESVVALAMEETE